MATSSKFYMPKLTPKRRPTWVLTPLRPHIWLEETRRNFAELELDVGVCRNECFHSGLFGGNSKLPEPCLLVA